MGWTEKLLTVKEVAEILRIAEKTVRELLKEGSLPGIKVGKTWRIPEDDLKKYIRGEWRP